MLKGPVQEGGANDSRQPAHVAWNDSKPKKLVIEHDVVHHKHQPAKRGHEQDRCKAFEHRNDSRLSVPGFAERCAHLCAILASKGPVEITKSRVFWMPFRLITRKLSCRWSV